MKNSNVCQDRYDAIVALVMGELDDQAAEALEQHFLVCDACRSVRDALAAEEVTVRAGFEALARRLEPIERKVLERLGNQSPQPKGPGDTLGRSLLEGVKTMFIAHKRFSLAATVMLMVAGGIMLYALAHPMSVAYALEQTVQANRKIVNYHVRHSPAEKGVGEAWAQLDEQGNLVRMRMDFPKTEDGPKITLWSKGKASVWLKAKNLYVTVNEPNILKRFEDLRALFDPKLVMERLEADKQAGKVQVQVKEPKDKGQPVELTASTAEVPYRRQVYLINAETKLVEQLIEYRRHADGEWQKVSTTEYLDYDKPIAPEIWEPELPKDIVKIDQTAQELGLAKGKLSNDEIAAKVAREFFEALVAEDYAKAGRLFEGIPADKMKEGFGRIKFRRVVEVGKPSAFAIPATGYLQVPVKVEIEEKGKVTTKTFQPLIRPLYNQPDRWAIGGGI